MSEPWTEARMQDEVANALRRRMTSLALVMPNVMIVQFGFECDLLAVTKAGLTHEVEIKVTRSDLRADLGKPKHDWMNPEGLWSQRGKPHPHTGATYDLTPHRERRTPNYFWFAVPEGLHDGIDLPPYAGLIEVTDHANTRPTRLNPHGPKRHIVKWTRDAPRLHRAKLEPKMRDQMVRNFCYRYWRERTGVRL